MFAALESHTLRLFFSFRLAAAVSSVTQILFSPTFLFPSVSHVACFYDQTDIERKKKKKKKA
jgi:hypothetical protein